MKPLAVVLGVACLLTSTMQAQTVKTFIGPDLNPCDNPEECFVSDPLFLTGINNQGQLSGYWFTENGTHIVQSVIMNSGTGDSVNVPVPSSLKSGFMWVGRINESGQVAGNDTKFYNKITARHAFEDIKDFQGVVGDAGSTKVFKIGGALGTSVNSINDLGETAGSILVRSGSNHGWYNHLKGKVEEIVYPGSQWTAVYDINNAGDVLGSFVSPNPNNPSVSGFLRHSGTWSRIEFPGADETIPLGLNNNRDVVGYYVLPGDWLQHGFTYIKGVYAQMDLGGQNVVLQDINDLGQIVGHGENISGILVGSFVVTP